MNFSEAENFLYELRNAGSKFSLSRMEKLCAYFGEPQQKFKSIHVAGTNGKGSVCAMLEAMLRGGFSCKTGLFTSPHLVYLGERIQINRKSISREKLLARILKIRAACAEIFNLDDSENYPSFFEYMTMAAFLEFADEGVDFAIVETGLGGRLDSTNVLKPLLSVITSISLDHTEFLGCSIEEIAAEKAGIIKQKTPLVAGFLPSSAMAAIEKVSDLLSSKIYKAEDFVKECDFPETSLVGNFQKRNAATSLLAMRVLSSENLGKISGIKYSEKSARAELLKVRWPARWQEISLSKKNGGQIKLFLDSSHNPEGAAALEENLKTLANSSKNKPAICVGILGKDRAKPILETIASYASKIILFVPKQPRALSFEEMEALIPKDFAREKILRREVEEVFSAPFKCVENFESEISAIVSSGSIYLAGEVLAALSGEKCDGLSDKI